MSYTSSVLTDNPFAYYRCNEVSGSTAYDSSGNGHDAAINGNIELGQNGAVLGGGSILLDGSSGYIALPSAVNVGGWSAISLEIWIKLSTVIGAYPRLISSGTPQSSNTDIDFGINLSSGDSGFFNVGTGSTNASLGFFQVWSTTHNTNGWYHLVMTYDGTTIAAYVDGVPSNSTTAGGAIAVSSNVNIGRNPAYNGDYLPASVAEIAIYPTALSAARISAHHAAGSIPPAVILPSVSRRDGAFPSFVHRDGVFPTTARRG
jgi:hypothetical protein